MNKHLKLKLNIIIGLLVAIFIAIAASYFIRWDEYSNRTYTVQCYFDVTINIDDGDITSKRSYKENYKKEMPCDPEPDADHYTVPDDLVPLHQISEPPTVFLFFTSIIGMILYFKFKNRQ